MFILTGEQECLPFKEWDSILTLLIQVVQKYSLLLSTTENIMGEIAGYGSHLEPNYYSVVTYSYK